METECVRNEKIYRAANRSVDHNRPTRPDELLLFLCECSDLECDTEIELTQREYTTVRRGELRFAVAPDHEDGHERVVDEFDRYTVVEK